MAKFTAALLAVFLGLSSARRITQPRTVECTPGSGGGGNIPSHPIHRPPSGGGGGSVGPPTPETSTTEVPSGSISGNEVGTGKLNFAPYYDVMMKEAPSMKEIYEKTGQKNFVLAFALGGHSGCDPKWGGSKDLDDPEIMGNIRSIQALGGEVIVATGGAVGPYLEHSCQSAAALAQAYTKVLRTVKSRHLDVDIEAAINTDMVNKALAMTQRQNRDVTVTYTMMVQGDDYGVTDALGVDVLKNAKTNGVNVHAVNAMTMEYPSSKDWGDSVIATGHAVLGQMKSIWPEKSDKELKSMLGITPMIGRNFNGKIFTPAHARKLVSWANANKIAFISFWSAGRDNGRCAGGAISPLCSSIAQGEFEFIKTFQQFKP